MTRVPMFANLNKTGPNDDRIAAKYGNVRLLDNVELFGTAD